MDFDILQPRFSLWIRSLMVIGLQILFFLISVMIILILLQIEKTNTSIDSKSFFNIIIVIWLFSNVLLVYLIYVITVKFIFDNDTKGVFTVSDKEIIVKLSDLQITLGHTEIQYLKFRSVLGWTKTLSVGYQVEIFKTDFSKMEFCEIVRVNQNDHNLEKACKQLGYNVVFGILPF